MVKIALIQKNESPTSVKNWGPISLGSTVYKTYAKIIWKRLVKVIDDILGPEQKAYRKSANIAETTANIAVQVGPQLMYGHSHSSFSSSSSRSYQADILPQ